MSAHTPGPWNVSSYGGGQYVQHWYVSGPSVHMDTSNKAELPDMYLIAAAPDLLTASKEAMSSMESIWRTAGHDDDWIYDEMGSELAAGYFSLRAAIAKATGEKA